MNEDELYNVVIMIMRHIRPDGEFSSFSFSEVNYIYDLLNKSKAEQAKLINKIKSKSEDK